MRERLIDIREVEHTTSLSEQTINRRVASGEFPRPIKLSPKRIAWVESEVQAWILTTIAKARGEDAPKEQE